MQSRRADAVMTALQTATSELRSVRLVDASRSVMLRALAPLHACADLDALMAEIKGRAKPDTLAFEALQEFIKENKVRQGELAARRPGETKRKAARWVSRPASL